MNLEQDYHDAVDEVCQAAGHNDGQWNVRFIVELHKRGLMLVPLPTQGESYYVQAPDPVGGELPTWYPALIVPRT